MDLWWLSFSDRHFLGAYLTYAPSDMAAYFECCLNGCNPGGECLFVGPVPEGEKRVPDEYLHRLLTKVECAELDLVMGSDGGVVRITEDDEQTEYPLGRLTKA